MIRTIMAAAAVLAAASAAPAYAEEGSPVIVQADQRWPDARIVDIRKEAVPIIRGRATGVVVNDLRTSKRIVKRPVESYVYVSTDPFDHVH